MNKNFYSEEEKKILWNYFILHAPGSKSGYRELLNNLAWKLNSQGSHAQVSENEIASVKLKFDTAHIQWDEKDNVVTKLVAQPQFLLSDKNLAKLNKIHPQWDYINGDKEHIAFIFARRQDARLAWKMLEDYQLDADLLNKEGYYFSYYLINAQSCQPEKIEKKNAKFFRALNIHLTHILKVFEKYPYHLNMNVSSHQTLLKNWHTMKKNMLDCWLHARPEMKKEVKVMFDELVIKLDKQMFYPYLNCRLNIEDKDKENDITVYKL
jgi:hypothetical protein